jgi:tetratricopeptide (TPR) repeat protein
VIASESTLGYKGQSIDLAQVGRELGVHFVLEGSVRKLDNRIRVNAQLIEASSGRHQWADRYDRELEDIFTVQDEIVREIVVAMDVQLIEGEQARTLATGTANLEAWECVRLGMPDAVNATTGANLKAKELFERAIELDPGYAVAWVMLGWIYQQYVDVASVSTDAHSSESVLKSMQECAEKALAIDPDCSEACCLMAMYYLEVKNFEAAIEMSEKSVRLAPGNAENLCAAGLVMNKSGNPERGLEFIKRAMRASPRYRPGFLRGAGTSYFLLGQYETAMRYFEESITREPDYLAAHTYLVSVFCRLDRLPDARRSAQEVFRLSPNFSVSSYLVGLSFSNPDIVRRMRNELRRAGLPE